MESVGSILRARTRDSNGNELGTFTSATRPTDKQVLRLIDTAVNDINLVLEGKDLPEAYWPVGHTLSSYRAACLVELSYFPEQITAGRSPYEQLKTLWDDGVAGLKAALSLDVGPGGSATVPAPVGSFPALDVPLELALGSLYPRGVYGGRA